MAGRGFRDRRRTACRNRCVTLRLRWRSALDGGGDRALVVPAGPGEWQDGGGEESRDGMRRTDMRLLLAVRRQARWGDRAPAEKASRWPGGHLVEAGRYMNLCFLLLSRQARKQFAFDVSCRTRIDQRSMCPMGHATPAGRRIPCRRMILSRLAWSARPSASAVRVTCQSCRSSADDDDPPLRLRLELLEVPGPPAGGGGVARARPDLAGHVSGAMTSPSAAMIIRSTTFRSSRTLFRRHS